jgi:MtN3 and saliva related transmembrane protein
MGFANNENMTELVGWCSSLILLVTISIQNYKQWKEGTSEGVSIWLFIGQLAASIGFAVYSWLLGNQIFIITNSLMILNSLVGFGIVKWNQRHHDRAGK